MLNALDLEARAERGTTILSRIRSSGLLRASRAFREGDAARIVVAHLGPGLVRGDAFRVGGRVAPGAHLIVAGQMTTRVLSGPEPIANTAAWLVERGASLALLAEPTLVAAAASYTARIEIALAPGARAVVVDVMRRERGAAVSLATTVRRGARTALRELLRFDRDDPFEEVVGTLAIFGGVDVAALDRAADEISDVRIGIGVLRDGDVLVRVIGSRVWDVCAALARLRSASMSC